MVEPDTAAALLVWREEMEAEAVDHAQLMSWNAEVQKQVNTELSE